MKVLIEIDTDEIASKMLELGAGEYMFSGEFWDVMAELYPPVMTEVHEEVTRLHNAVQAVADAGTENTRPYYTVGELDTKFWR